MGSTLSQQIFWLRTRIKRLVLNVYMKVLLQIVNSKLKCSRVVDNRNGLETSSACFYLDWANFVVYNEHNRGLKKKFTDETQIEMSK